MASQYRTSSQQNRSQSRSGYRPVQPGYQQGRPLHGSARSFNMQPEKKRSPKKKIALGVAIVLVVLVGLIGLDFGLNANKVHQGVTVEGVAVGGMTQQEAAEAIQSTLNSRFATVTVQAKPDAAAEERLLNRAVAESGQTEEEADLEALSAESSVSWSFSSGDLGVQVDADRLAKEAYTVGQVTDVFDFFPALSQRIGSLFGQVDLKADLRFDEELLETALKPITDTIGIGMVNSNITVDGEGFASLRSGQVGLTVDKDRFKERAQDIFLSGETQGFEIALAEVPLEIQDDEAQAVADVVNAAIAEPVVFTYEENTWEVGTASLGSWITTEVEGSGNTASLKPLINTAAAYDGVQDIMGEVGYGSAKNAHIDVSSGTPAIVGGTAGIGPDIKTAVSDLQNILFGADASAARQVVCSTAEVEPEITAETVASYGIVNLITTYQLGYGSGGGSNREFNIERCLDTLNGSLVAPGANWEWNEIVGPCYASTGYKDAGVIGADNKVSDAEGGGICNVATGVFNAAYEAGLPVLERANHTLYMSNYPTGRDAAVSWEYPTLVFQNDTDQYIYVTAEYNGQDMFISIWGTSPGRSVESANSEWEEKEDGGKSIINYRTVRSADGSIWFEDSFYSYFPPVPKDGE